MKIPYNLRQILIKKKQFSLLNKSYPKIKKKENLRIS